MSKEDNKRVPLLDCVSGRLYKISCRNLKYGVFNGIDGFIGIREKFNDLYLFTEYHWDTGPSHGTVHGVEDTGIDLPYNIKLKEYLGTIDSITQRSVVFDRPVSEGGSGWVFEDTNEPSQSIRPINIDNRALFDWLMQHEVKAGTRS